MDEHAWDALKRAATDARRNAYAPYSTFTVGAAVQTRSGAVFPGCNVENASYGATICAERAALAAAVAAGERELIALPSLQIRSYTGDARAEYDLASLLPDAFGRDQLD